jgi:hypothetical protein
VLQKKKDYAQGDLQLLSPTHSNNDSEVDCSSKQPCGGVERAGLAWLIGSHAAKLPQPRRPTRCANLLHIKQKRHHGHENAW